MIMLSGYHEREHARSAQQNVNLNTGRTAIYGGIFTESDPAGIHGHYPRPLRSGNPKFYYQNA